MRVDETSLSCHVVWGLTD
uniref:Uncharacterized protein n=1 Tax=Anguilla anguilla TaxID=7936 RepID=A0A0E9TK88_ANGAN